MAAMIIRIKASNLPGLWALSSKYLFAGSQLQASQKRYFAALGYRPLNGGPNLFAINRLSQKCDPQFRSKSFKTKIKELMDSKVNPDLLKYQQKLGDVIKILDRKSYLAIGSLSLVLLTLAYIRGDSEHKLATAIEADKERIKQKLQEEERELKDKRSNTSHVTPFSKVMKKNDNMEKDYALPCYTSAPKQKTDLIGSSSLCKDMPGPDGSTFLQTDQSSQCQVEQNIENVASGKDVQIPCVEPSPCKDVQKSEDVASKSNDQIPCSSSPPCKDVNKPERSISNSLISSIKSPPYKGVQKNETLTLKSNYQSPYVKSSPCKDKSEELASKSNSQSPYVKSSPCKDKYEELASKSNSQSPYVKSSPCKDKYEELASKSNSQNPCVRSPSIKDMQKSEELVPTENSHNFNIKPQPVLDFQKSDEMMSANDNPISCSKTPPRPDLHKAKEWSLTKCSQVKTPPGINLGNSTMPSDPHDTSNISSSCTVQKENTESSVNKSELTDVTSKVPTLACTETKADHSKGINTSKRLIRLNSPEKPVKENHKSPDEKQAVKFHVKKMHSGEVVTHGANIKKNKSPQNIIKTTIEPYKDLTAQNISQNNATSCPSKSPIAQKAPEGGQGMVCTIDPQEIEMDLSTTIGSNPEKDSQKRSTVAKSPIGNFMKKDCTKPEKKVCLKSNFKDKSLEKDNTTYKRREVIEVNENVCVDDK